MHQWTGLRLSLMFLFGKARPLSGFSLWLCSLFQPPGPDEMLGDKKSILEPVLYFRFLYLNRPQSTSRDKNPTSILGNQSYNPTFTSLFHQGYHESRDCGARSMHCNTPLSSDTSHESKSLFGDLRFGGQFGFSMNFHSHIDQTSQLWHGTTGQWPQVTLLITPRMGYSFKTSDFWSQGRTVEVWLGCVLCLKQLYSFRKLLRVVNDKQISTDLRCETVLADLVLNLR